nr:MAG TPA: hypothetical protein [Caudoviricetes sp.]
MKSTRGFPTRAEYTVSRGAMRQHRSALPHTHI